MTLTRRTLLRISPIFTGERCLVGYYQSVTQTICITFFLPLLLWLTGCAIGEKKVLLWIYIFFSGGGDDGGISWSCKPDKKCLCVDYKWESPVYFDDDGLRLLVHDAIQSFGVCFFRSVAPFFYKSVCNKKYICITYMLYRSSQHWIYNVDKDDDSLMLSWVSWMWVKLTVLFLAWWWTDRRRKRTDGWMGGLDALVRKEVLFSPFFFLVFLVAS